MNNKHFELAKKAELLYQYGFRVEQSTDTNGESVLHITQIAITPMPPEGTQINISYEEIEALISFQNSIADN